MGTIQSTEGLNRNKRQRKVEFTPSSYLWDSSFLLLPLHWSLYPWLSWFSGFQTETKWHHQFFWGSSFQIHHMTPFFIINTHMCTHTPLSYWFCFLWRTLTNAHVYNLFCISLMTNGVKYLAICLLDLFQVKCLIPFFYSAVCLFLINYVLHYFKVSNLLGYIPWSTCVWREKNIFVSGPKMWGPPVSIWSADMNSGQWTPIMDSRPLSACSF